MSQEKPAPGFEPYGWDINLSEIEDQAGIAVIGWMNTAVDVVNEDAGLKPSQIGDFMKACALAYLADRITYASAGIERSLMEIAARLGPAKAAESRPAEGIPHG